MGREADFETASDLADSLARCIVVGEISVRCVKASALATAEKVKLEMTAMKSENEALLAKAREERTLLLKEAKDGKDAGEAKELKELKPTDELIGTNLQSSL